MIHAVNVLYSSLSSPGHLIVTEIFVAIFGTPFHKHL